MTIRGGAIVRRIVGVLALIALIVAGGYALGSSVFAQQATPVSTETAGGTPDTGVGGPVSVGTPAAAATPSTGLTTLRFAEHASHEQTIDVDPTGDSVGDLLVFANPVFDENDVSQVGSDQGSCVRTVVGQAWECTFTVILDNGQLTIEGPFNDTGETIFAVTGGTGDFLGASGQLRFAARPNTTNEFDMTFELL
jgi:allene oxide cyclase